MKLRWTDRAKKDLLELGAYTARGNPEAARRWVEGLREWARGAVEAPRTGRAVPELGREDVREVLLRTCRVVYEVREDAVHALTVFEGHRLFQSDDE
ncbi:MAG: type II toxin-antitoxin system RelE/ParE family toxin [Deferrisomatales bacterium]